MIDTIISTIKENAPLFTISIACVGFIVQTILAKKRLNAQQASTQLIIDRLVDEIKEMSSKGCAPNEQDNHEHTSTGEMNVLEACSIAGVSNESVKFIADMVIDGIDDPEQLKKLARSFPELVKSQTQQP